MERMNIVKNKKAVFFTETGEGIGYGHLIRCEALRNSLEMRGLETDICMFVRDWPEFKYERSTFQNWMDMNVPIPAGDIAVVDSYISNSEALKRISENFSYTAVIDDFNRIYYPFDLIVNPNVHGSEIQYDGQTAKVISGNRYTILRPQFKDRRNDFVVREKIQKVILTSGGSDYRHLIPKFATFVNQYPDIEFIALAGIDEYADELNRKYQIPNLKILRKLDAKSMIDLLCTSDLVITAAGQTMNELAFLGIPFVAICIDYDQVNNIKSFYDRGCIREILNWDDSSLLEKVSESIEVLKPKSERTKIYEVGRSLIDGKGADNLAAQILEFSSETASHFG
ncbi:glycosyltransferase family 28 C-terminal domain protein [Leptospira kmetyi serovar Malaysia str. Bejo-Iso9]|nr:glycosyltransferase family 28 C-terminal domain protein [Leptospira kmetyi serovar Malaysia str. Bejo-Iso9]